MLHGDSVINRFQVFKRNNDGQNNYTSESAAGKVFVVFSSPMF